MADSCPKQQEFAEFQKHLLQIYLESCDYGSSVQKNRLAIEFIAKHAAEIRKYFCDSYCSGSHDCIIYKAIKSH